MKNFLHPNGKMWITYYKGTSKYETDVNRDNRNVYGKKLGFQGVAMIYVDENWSALRFKIVG